MPRKPAIQISVDRLRELFEVRDDGRLVRRVTASSRAAEGMLAGSQRSDGYWRVCVDGTHVLVHRVVFALTHGYWPALDIDHRDGDTGNNRPENLREATHQQNHYNRANRHKLNTSGVRGVTWDNKRGLWAVQVNTNGKNHHFGRWEDLELAALIAEEARRILFGASLTH